MDAEIVVTKSELFATHRQQVRPRTHEEAVEIFSTVLRTYKAYKVTGPIAVNFNQGGLTVIEYDEIVRIPKGGPVDKAVEELFAKRSKNNLLTEGNT